MGKVIINFDDDNPEIVEAIRKWKEHFKEKTTSKAIEKLIMLKPVVQEVKEDEQRD